MIDGTALRARYVFKGGHIHVRLLSVRGNNSVLLGTIVFSPIEWETFLSCTGFGKGISIVAEEAAQ